MNMAPEIKTSYWAKPIPDRRFDWSAYYPDLEDSSPIGYGRTEAEAVADLIDNYELPEG